MEEIEVPEKKEEEVAVEVRPKSEEVVSASP